MTSSQFDLDLTSKPLNLSFLWFNERFGSENIARYNENTGQKRGNNMTFDLKAKNQRHTTQENMSHHIHGSFINQ